MMEAAKPEPTICVRFYSDDSLSSLLVDLSWELSPESTIRDVVITQDSELDRWHATVYRRIPSHAVSREMLAVFDAGFSAAMPTRALVDTRSTYQTGE